MTQAHTPGPWYVTKIGTLAFISQRCDEDGAFAISRVFFPNYHPDGLAAARNEFDANAELIARAPDLLAENERLRHLLEKSMALISRGLVEGAYEGTIGGNEYANRIWDAAKAEMERIVK